MQHSVVTVFVSSAFYYVATNFPLWQQIFLWLFNTLSYKVCRSAILCRDTLMGGCLNIYVVTLTILLRNCFCTASSNIVTTQFLCRDSIYVGSCCNNVSCIVSIPIVTRKICRDRVLSPLNLISYCSFI